MIPGKQYTPELILQIAWRRKWLILLPAVAIATGVALWVRQLPDLYEADATILVVPQRVPENYVRPAVSTSIDDRLTTISHQIMSRSRLERIIQEFNLYPEWRKTGLMEDIVSVMRNNDIVVEVMKGDEFKVGYLSGDPRTAMRVAERLASLFIDENLMDRERLAQTTNQFLESQVEDARRRLIDNEKKLEAYRRQHNGELPTQVDSNLQAIHSTEMQLQQLTDSISRDRDQRLVLQRVLADSSAWEASTPSPAQNADDGSTGSAADQLRDAQAELREMQLRLKPEHPDIGIKKRQIAQLQKLAEAEAADAPVSEGVNPTDVIRRNKLNEAKEGIANLDKSLATKQEDEKQLHAQLADYYRKLNAAPTRETELADLTRDYETYQTVYKDLLNKKEESRITANLERRQNGEQFKILEPPLLPERPATPDRPRLYLLGIAASFAIGLGLAGLVEYLDRTMRSEDDVKAALNVLVLATVPIMQNVEVAKRRRNLVAAFVSVGAAMAVGAAAVAWKLLR